MKALKIYACLIVEEETNLWHQQFTRTLRAMGHEVFVPTAMGLRESWRRASSGLWSNRDRALMTEKIIRGVMEIQNKSGLDLFFCYLYPFQFLPELFSQLSRKGIPSVHFFCDHFSHPEVAKHYGPRATLSWVPEKEAMEPFRRSNAKAVYLPMAANPQVNFPVSCPNEELCISFAGTKNPYRRDLIGKLMARGLPVSVSGDGWNPKAPSYHSLETTRRDSLLIGPNPLGRTTQFLRWKMNAIKRFARFGLRPKKNERWYSALGLEYDDLLTKAAVPCVLGHDTMNAQYGRSAVSLGINDQFIPERKDPIVIYSKLRDIEAAMSGACYLTQRTPEIEDLFVDEKEVMLYSTVDEMAEKAVFLLKNEAVRKRLRAACREKALHEHAWAQRFDKIFAMLGIVR